MNQITTMGDYIDNYEHITDLTSDGQCSNCGGCCSNYLPVSESDLKKIRKYIKKYNIHDMREDLPAQVTIDMRCPFRDEKNLKCVIYPVRPQICRSFICNMNEKNIIRNKNIFHHRYDICDLTELI